MRRDFKEQDAAFGMGEFVDFDEAQTVAGLVGDLPFQAVQFGAIRPVVGADYLTLVVDSED